MITSSQKLKLEKERLRIEEEEKYAGVAFTIKQVGIGDGVQFTSLPENFFRTTNKKLIDLSQPWYLDYNPYVIRDRNLVPKKTIELWNYPTVYDWPKIRSTVYLSNAEIHCSIMGIQYPYLIRPKLYRFDDFPFHERNAILFHAFGRSHGPLPDYVIDHVLKKYKGNDLYQIGLENEPDLGIKRIKTPTHWQLTEVISQCRMLIGVDSGPAWIAGCYPDVIVKKIRTRFQFGYCEPKDWVPLLIDNPHSFWDDRMFKIYNIFDQDIGFTESYHNL